MITMRNSVLAGIILVLGATVWALYYFAPERTAMRAFDSLLRAASKRNWDRVLEKTAPDYRDAWHDSPQAAVSNASEAMRHFFFLRISAPDAVWNFESKRAARVSAKIVMEGNGSAIAQSILNHVNAWPEPAVFVFRREGSWPGTWLLERVEQPGLGF